jgi:hypothetical protein
MDTFAGRIFDPQSLHKYVYGHNNPVMNVDPSGNFIGVLGAGLTATQMYAVATVAFVGIIAWVYAVLWQAGLVNSITHGQSLVDRLERSSSAQREIEQTRARAKSKVREATRRRGCGGNILYHYTNRVAAYLIWASDYMFVTDAITDPSTLIFYPAGAWATSIEPWDKRYTMLQLAAVFYFSTTRQRTTDLSYFVAICNDRPPLFKKFPGTPTYVKPDGNINALVAGKSGMI